MNVIQALPTAPLAPPRSPRRGIDEWVVSILLLTILGILIAYPVVMLAVGGWRADTSEQGSMWASMSRVFEDPRFYEAWKNTLIVSLMASLFGLVFGLVLTFLVERTDLPGSKVFKALIMAPIFIAPFIGAIAWTGMAAPRVGVLNRLLALIDPQWGVNIYSLVGIAIVLGIYKVPYVYLFTSGPLRSLDGGLEEASRLAGRGTLATLMRITLPMIRPSIIAVLLLCFVLSLENFGVLAILGIPAQIPFVASELYIKFTRQPPDYAYATIVSLTLIAVTSVGLWVQRRLTRGNDYVAISGRGYRASTVALKSLKGWAFGFASLYMVISVLLPFGVLLFASFQPYWSTTEVGFTLDNYVNMFSRQALVRATQNSLFLSLLTATVTVCLGVAIAYLVQRTRAPGRTAIDVLSALPVSIPGIAFGVALLWAWISIPLPIFGTIWILLIAYIAKFVPLGVRNISAALTQVGPELEAAARISGASRMQAALTVTLPLLRNSIFSSWILLFISTIKELNCSVLLYSFTSVVLPVIIYDAQEEGNFPRVAALACGLSITILVCLVVAQRLFNLRVTK